MAFSHSRYRLRHLNRGEILPHMSSEGAQVSLECAGAGDDRFDSLAFQVQQGVSPPVTIQKPVFGRTAVLNFGQGDRLLLTFSFQAGDERLILIIAFGVEWRPGLDRTSLGNSAQSHLAVIFANNERGSLRARLSLRECLNLYACKHVW